MHLPCGALWSPAVAVSTLCALPEYGQQKQAVWPGIAVLLLTQTEQGLIADWATAAAMLQMPITGPS